MPIFKKTKLNKILSKRVLGVYIPQELYELISLYCLFKGFSKSYWASVLMQEKMEEFVHIDTSFLLNGIAQQAFEYYLENEQDKNPNFFKELKKQLSMAKLDNYIIDNIIIKVNKKIINEKNKK